MSTFSKEESDTKSRLADWDGGLLRERFFIFFASRCSGNRSRHGNAASKSVNWHGNTLLHN
jgi:hypothetical protein